MTNLKTIVLRKPLSYGKDESAKTVTEIVLREPTAGDYEDAEKGRGAFGISIALISILSGVPVDVIDEMYGSQLAEAEEFIGGFGGEFLNPARRSPDELDLTLVTPLTLEAPLNLITLHLCEPTNKQRRRANEAGGAFASSVVLISLVGNIPKMAVRALCARDFLAACGYFSGFQIRLSANSDV